jgi:mannose-6-phosphate isomerase
VDGQTLDAALAALGEPPLPFLLKLLAAGSSLSIQAHPTKTEAEAGFAREEAAGVARDADDRLYRDDNHKPEIIVALSDEFRALVGLRPVAQTRRSSRCCRAHRVHWGRRAEALDRLDTSPAATDEVTSRCSARPSRGRSPRRHPTSHARRGPDAAAADAAEPGDFADEIAVLRAAASDFPGTAASTSRSS